MQNSLLFGSKYSVQKKTNFFLIFCGKELKSFLLQAKSLIEKRKRTIKLERNNKRRSSLSSVTESSRNNQQNNLQSFTKEDEDVNLNYELSQLLNVPYQTLQLWWRKTVNIELSWSFSPFKRDFKVVYSSDFIGNIRFSSDMTYLHEADMIC